MDEHLASDILLAALRERRAGEFIDCLFAGGSATVDRDNRLVLISNDVLQQFNN